MAIVDTKISDFREIVESKTPQRGLQILFVLLASVGFWYLLHDRLFHVVPMTDRDAIYKAAVIALLSVILAFFLSALLFRLVKTTNAHKEKNTVRLRIGYDGDPSYFECSKGNPIVRDSLYLRIIPEDSAKIIAFSKKLPSVIGGDKI